PPSPSDTHVSASCCPRRCTPSSPPEDSGEADVLSVKELRTLSGTLKPEAFRKQLGPFVLIQKPEGKSSGGTDQMGLPVNVAQTRMVKPEKAQAGALALLFQFEELEVATVPPLAGEDQLSVGR